MTRIKFIKEGLGIIALDNIPKGSSVKIPYKTIKELNEEDQDFVINYDNSYLVPESILKYMTYSNKPNFRIYKFNNFLLYVANRDIKLGEQCTVSHFYEFNNLEHIKLLLSKAPDGIKLKFNGIIKYLSNK